MRVDDGRDARPPALPGRAGGAPEGHRDRHPVARPNREALWRDEARDGNGGRQRAGQAARPGPSAFIHGDREDPEVLRFPLARADGQDRAPVGQPGDGAPDPVEGVDPNPRPRGALLRTPLRWPARAATDGSRSRQRCHDQVGEAVAEHRVDETGAIWRREGRHSEAIEIVTVIDRAGREGRPIAPTEGHPDNLEPAVAVRCDQQPAAVGKPARARLPRPCTGHDALVAAGHVDDRHLRRGEVRVALGEHRDHEAIGRPLEIVDVDPAGCQRPRLGALLANGPGSTPGQGRVDDPGLAPAAATRYERDPAAVGRPPWRALAGRVIRDDRWPAAVDPDDPDGLLADIGQPGTVGRPLWVADGVLGRGELAGEPRAQVQDERLARPGRLGRVRDAAAVRRETRLAGRVHGHDLLDAEGRGAGSSARLRTDRATWRTSATASAGLRARRRARGGGAQSGRRGRVDEDRLRLVLRARGSAASAGRRRGRGVRGRRGGGRLGGLDGRHGVGKEGLVEPIGARGG